MKKSTFFAVAIWSSVFVMLVVTIVSLVYFMKQINSTQITEEEFVDYQYHYAFITGDAQDAYYQSIYESARQRGEEEDIYVEYLGKNLAVNYSQTDLMRIAIAAGVDGIIVEADESEEMVNLIDEAVNGEKSIPVVTVGTDCTGSMRQSFVGISYYDLGQLYGEQVLKLTQNKSDGPFQVMILMKSDYENSSQNIIFSGIKEVLKENYLIETAAVSNEFSYSAEESIRDIIMKGDQLPDVLICLDKVTTTCTYQAVVDYNKVGDVEIIGYYDSDDILDALEKNVIQATIAVDTGQMGEYCVTALEEYRSTGYVSGYMPVDMTLITTDNVKEYRVHEEEH